MKNTDLENKQRKDPDRKKYLKKKKKRSRKDWKETNDPERREYKIKTLKK